MSKTARWDVYKRAAVCAVLEESQKIGETFPAHAGRWTDVNDIWVSVDERVYKDNYGALESVTLSDLRAAKEELYS